MVVDAIQVHGLILDGIALCFARVEDRAPHEQLITREATKRGKKRDRQWLYHWRTSFCAEAKIPPVCVHSLRGLHATLATEAGMSSHVVANALGHSSPAVTHAHYIQPSTQKRMSTTRGGFTHCLGSFDDDLGALSAGLRMPSPEAVALLRSGLARERVALDELRDARRQLSAGIRVARDRDRASYWAIASAIVPGGAGRDPLFVHRERLELAKRLRQRTVR